MKYLFDYWPAIKEDLAKKDLFLFLDFDGTLSPIADTPKQARLPLEVKKILQKISTIENCRLAIISGRSLKDIKEKVNLKNIVYAGNHGIEIEGPKLKHELMLPDSYYRTMRQIKNELERSLNAFPGVHIEDKKFTLSVHYRLVTKKDLPLVKAAIHDAAITHLLPNRIEIKSGKMVAEIRPNNTWGKGKVTLWLLARAHFNSKKKILPIYIGDDTTDEDAFSALKGKGPTILVGKTHPSLAEYYLKNPKEVLRFLKMIVAFYNQSSKK